MANEKPNENGSQFYITLRDTVEPLDQKHTIFGTVAEGLEVLDKMNSTMVDETEAPSECGSLALLRASKQGTAISSKS